MALISLSLVLNVLHSGLKNPVLVIDPSQGMLEVAKTKEGVTTMLATGHEFVSSPAIRNYNRILIGRCFHHLLDPSAMFKLMRENCRPDTLCLVLHLIEVPFLSYGSKIASNGLPLESILSPLENTGWAMEKHMEECLGKVIKGEWYSRIRGRMFSSLEVFTDDEIEAGLEELDKTEMKDIALHEKIDIRENYVCLQLTLPLS